MNCLQGILLLQFMSAESAKSAADIAKATGIGTSKQVGKYLDILVTANILKLDSNLKYSVNTCVNPENYK